MAFGALVVVGTGFFVIYGFGATNRLGFSVLVGVCELVTVGINDKLEVAVTAGDSDGIVVSDGVSDVVNNSDGDGILDVLEVGVHVAVGAGD